MVGSADAALPTSSRGLVLRGRARELAAAQAALGGPALVSLVGPGGAGKTALARELLAQRRAGGGRAAFVDLSGVAEEDGAVVSAVAHALGVREAVGDLLANAVVSAATPLDLVVVDNCEHVASEVASLAGHLRTVVPTLVTSREPLSIPGEVVVRIGPLPVVGDGDDAMRLFVERATAADPTLQPADHTGAIRRICEAVGALPLGIELAAACAGALDVEALADRLERSLDVLARGRTGRRHDLSAALGWSVDTLSDEERRAAVALTVFAGRFDLDAAEKVAATTAGVLASLVDRSIVTREGPLYRLLPPLKHALVTGPGGVSDDVRERHLRFVVDLLRSAEQAKEPPLSLMQRHDADMEHAFRWACDSDQVGVAVELCRLAQRMYFWPYGELWRVDRWLRDLRSRPLQGRERVYTLLAETVVASEQGQRDVALALAEEGLAAAREEGDSRLVAEALSRAVGLGSSQRFERFEEVAAMGPERAGVFTYYWVMAQLTRSMGHDLRLIEACDRVNEVMPGCLRDAPLSRQAVLLEMRGLVHLWRGLLHEAEDSLVQALDRARTPGTRSVCGGALGLVHAMRGEVERSLELTADAAATSAAGDVGSVASWCAGYHAEALLRAGEIEPSMAVIRTLLAQPWDVRHGVYHGELARAHLLLGDVASARTEIDRARRMSDPMPQMPKTVLEVITGAVEGAEGDPGAAARLLRAAQTALAADAIPLALDASDHLVPLLEKDGNLEGARVLADAAAANREALGLAAPPWATPRSERTDAPTLDQAIRVLTRARTAKRRPTFGWASLTVTEAQVAELVAAGLTNAEVAARMFITAGTVKVHVSRILTKLGLRSRTELAAEMASRRST